MNLQAIREHRFTPRRITYLPKDTALYALSVGAGTDPLDERQLALVYEKRLSALPTMAAVLAFPGSWIAEPIFEVNYLKLLHGEQNLIVHAPLPAEGEIEATYAVQAVADKGEGKGAAVFFKKELRAVAGGTHLCSVYSTLFLRGDGGCGSFGTPPPALPANVPAAEFSDELKTSAGAALLYRLNGDLNPIHVDPESACRAGFARPILHGLCTYGVAGYLLTRAVCNYEPARLRSLGVRFSSPVYPGETIRIEGVKNGGVVQFQARVVERDQIVLTHGHAHIE